MTDDVKIIRTPRTKNRPYFSMARASAQDDNLSWEARGVLAYLLSKPDDWQVQITDLQQHCGRDKVRNILAELKQHRYISVQQQHDPVTGHFLRNEYTVHETPFTEMPSTVEPSTDSPSTANPTLTDNREEQKTEVEQPRKSKRSVATKTATPDELELIEAWCTAMGYDGALAGATYDTNYNRAAARKMLKWDAPATPEEVRKVVILNRRGRQEYSMDFVRQDIPVMRAQENLGAVKPAFVSEWDRVRNRDTQGGQK